MKRIIKLSIPGVLLLFFTNSLSFAQVPSNMSCGAEQARQQELLENSSFAVQQERFEQSYRSKMISKSEIQGTESAKMAGEAVYTIPVVVHVIHSGQAIGTTANPSDEDINIVIQEATERFNHASGLTFGNPFSGANTNINLCLAQTSPEGFPSSGILRYNNPVLASLPDDPETSGDYWAGVPGFAALQWDNSLYCNIYIVTSLPDASGVYIFSGTNNFDATVYDSNAFWSGLVCHEIGHYLNLRHTFQDSCPNNDCLSDGDRVCDTPPKGTSGFSGSSCNSPGNSCTTDEDDPATVNPYRSTALGGLGDQPDINENYMDYTGSCWEAFTVGQKDRMRAYIQSNRLALVNNAAACNAPALQNNDLALISIDSPAGDQCNSAVSPSVSILNAGLNTITSADVNVTVNGSVQPVYDWSGMLLTGSGTTVNLPAITLASGANTIIISVSNPNGVADDNPTNDVQSIVLNLVSSIPAPLTEDFEGGTFPPVGWTLVDAGGTATWASIALPVGVDCSPSNAAFINHYNYNNIGGEDMLVTPLMDLSGLSNTTLSFDYAYAPYNATYNDGFRVEVSNDCRETWTVFMDAEYEALATAPATTSGFDPSCEQWISMGPFDLSAFDGQEVYVRFVGINGWGNNFFLDNINLSGEAAVTCGTNTVVTGLVANPTPSGTNASLSWDAVPNANLYQAKGRRVGTVPFGQFTTINTFKNVGGLNPGTDYEWRVRARCTDGAITQFSAMDTFSTASPALKTQDYFQFDFNIIPNPAGDFTDIAIEVFEEGDIFLQISDLQGKIIQETMLPEAQFGGLFRLDLSNISAGLYLIEIRQNQRSAVRKLIKE